MAGPILHLRAETKPLVTPSTTKALLDAGFTVNVEHSPLSIFPATEFEAVGAKLVPTGSWQSAPTDHIIIGLKELPEESFPLKHTHIQFAHCYKNQGGWEEVLGRFVSGGGTLLDLEFLQDQSGRRVAAFGYHAGYVGAALAVQTWAWQLSHPRGEALPAVSSYRNEGLLLEDIRTFIAEGRKISGRHPRVLVIGALGRCGRGAVELCQKVGIPDTDIIQWDVAETSAKSGPYKEIIESDIFINCIYLSTPIPPFVDATSLSTPDHKLSVICDVSCDTTNPHNPIPVYSINTTFSSPTVPVELPSNPSNTPLSVISIDHLPSLLPREASEAFSAALLPSLMGLKDRSQGKVVRVWKQAEELFAKKIAELPKGTQST